MKRFRREMMIIYQDPFASLDPRMTIRDTIVEPMEVHDLVGSREEKEERLIDLMLKVGLTPDQMNRYPHEFSGGQRQRIGIARALAINPKFIVADEPVSALDVSIQAQIINLLRDLQTEFHITYLFIAHDLSVIKHISDRITVMYLGKIVEMTSKKELFDNPLHPYTEALLSSVPISNPRMRRKKKENILMGDVPSPINPPSGCRFRTRCPKAKDVCKEKELELVEIGREHFVACHFV
jgi:peptide/nickel transport system ATP-binding protein/oligopeptide transport system ATP-binding protein